VCGCACAVGFLLVSAVFFALGRKAFGSLWEAVISWGLVSLIMGVWAGLREWKHNESAYRKADDETKESS
jgi:hypothetical protein